VFDLQELVAVGSVPLDGADLLRRLVAARTAFLVTGGTGTGKTTRLKDTVYWGPWVGTGDRARVRSSGACGRRPIVPWGRRA